MRTTSQVYKVNDTFEWLELAYRNRWTDGLPVIPPVREKVEEMIDYIGLAPDHMVGIVPPKMGNATIEKLAIQCVMAGCRPEYFPVVLAALQAMLEEPFNLNGVQCTAHDVAPLIIVSGPIVKQLEFNYSFGQFGGGSRANATVGRAIRLILWNIGGGYTGEPDRATNSHPGRYTYCIAENPDANPWPPLHSDFGVPPDKSGVTVFAAEAPHFCQYGITCPPADNLYVIADVMATLGNNNQYGLGQIFVKISSGLAPAFGRDGWTKRDVQQFLFEHARTPLKKLRRSPFWENASQETQWPKWIYLSNDDEQMPVVRRPEDIITTVGGGVGAPVVCPGWGHYGGYAVAKPIEMPQRKK
ncbi:MAG: hypothetical protein HY684_07380 [Chloroflexi bacterium]|nr:hypothetical protein [Chloroflexota bacterium]